MTSRMVDLIDENYDLAVRHKIPPNPELVIRKLADYRFLVCGSPSYFEKHPYPRQPADLAVHNCLICADSEQGESWPIFNTNDNVLLTGNLHSNDITSLVEAAENDLGVTVAPHFAIRDSLKSGRLIAVLSEFTTSFPIIMVYPQRGSIPTKVRLSSKCWPSGCMRSHRLAIRDSKI